MKYLVLGLLLLGVYFCLPLFFPAKKAWIAWPYGKNTKSWLPFIQRLPASCASMGAASPAILPLLGAVVGLFWNSIMPTIWPALVVCGAVVSALLYILYFNRYAILPLIVDAALLWGILGAGWTNWTLNGW
jgi:hypothetical protein